MKYKFRNRDALIKKTAVSIGLLAILLSLALGAAFLVPRFIGPDHPISPFASMILCAAFVILLYDPVKSLLSHIAERHLFHKKYNYQEILKDASRGMSRIESLEHLLNLVVHFITMRIRIKNATIFTMDDEKKVYRLRYQRGHKKFFLDYRLKPENPLVQYLLDKKEVVEIERLKELIGKTGGRLRKTRGTETHDLKIILGQMIELDAVCCVPSFLGRELRTLLLLGAKKSGDFYTDEDMNVLFTLAQESAIAIENARLYDEAVNKTYELEKINEQLQYSKSLLVKALQDTEVANKQLQDTQAQLIHEQKMATLGRLAASVGHEVNNPLTILSMNVSRAILKLRKNPDLKVAEITDLFEKMEQNINRIKAVVNTLTGLLKRSEKGIFEPLSLKLVIEETLPLVQFQTYLDNLSGTDVEFEIPGNIPLIRGDLERLQEVFLNLFINAYHAMQGKRNRRIRIKAEIDAENPKIVSVYFTDNGSGMSEEVIKKIFNYRFTTKPEGKGSGMGLYMCKYIIELHGGMIKVQSKVGHGTTFHIGLPIYEEMTQASAVRAQASS